MTTVSPSWPAPAKLNLFLHVTGRRADGYHELQTVFQFLDYGDTLRFTVRADGAVTRANDLPGVAAEQDLGVRAARLLQASAGTRLGVEIAVDKRLPMGGGLGGGSSDAATTLVALNALWGLGWSRSRLAALGLELGADVPVFVHGQAAWAEGVGERLTPVELPEPWFVVLIPPVQVATAEIFGAPELIRDCRPITIADFLAGAAGNVCEKPARDRYPEVAGALDWLAAFTASRMTGTGACVFGACQTEARGHAILAQLPDAWRRRGWCGFVARAVNVSPLHRCAIAESRDAAGARSY